MNPRRLELALLRCAIGHGRPEDVSLLWDEINRLEAELNPPLPPVEAQPEETEKNKGEADGN